MSDWEDLCGWMGVANDEFAVDKIVDFIDRSNKAEERQLDHDNRYSQKMVFDTYQEAASWAKRNPGKAITRSPDGCGFIEK